LIAFLTALIVLALDPGPWIFQMVCLIGLIIGSLAYTKPDLMWAMSVRGDRMLGIQREDAKPLDWPSRSSRMGVFLMVISFLTILLSVAEG
jgi:hypothetical protein